jgi:hypothetical protein
VQFHFSSDGVQEVDSDHFDSETYIRGTQLLAYRRHVRLVQQRPHPPTDDSCHVLKYMLRPPQVEEYR